MNRPSGGEPERHADSSRLAASSHADDSSTAAVESPTATEALPPGGHLVWVPPQGDPREVAPSSFGLEGPPTDEPARTCPDCDAARSVETVVREHAECGYVSPEGFLGTAGEQFVCPKCEAAPDGDVTEAFGIVTTVHSCLHCGRILDRPLGGDRSDD